MAGDEVKVPKKENFTSVSKDFQSFKDAFDRGALKVSTIPVIKAGAFEDATLLATHILERKGEFQRTLKQLADGSDEVSAGLVKCSDNYDGTALNATKTSEDLNGFVKGMNNRLPGFEKHKSDGLVSPYVSVKD